MKRLSVRHATPLVAIIVAVFFLTSIAVITFSAVTHAGNDSEPKNGHLITIHDRGVERVILSSAETIGDALKEAKISFDNKDLIEPAVGEKLVASNYQVNIYRARPVLVIDGNIRQKIITPYQTPEQIAKSAGIVLYPEDKTKLDLVGDLADGVGLQLNIDRATAFIFTLYGKTSTVRTQALTIKEMLAEKNIKLSKDDRFSIDLGTKITDGLSVRLWREGKQTITVDEPINFDIQKIEDADREVGYKEIKTAGENGSRSVTYEVTIQDGKEIGRKEIASLTTKQPQKQIEIDGVKGQYTTPGENETITWNYLTSNGYSRVQTAGIMGNLMQEHGFNTSGDGLAQWTSGRKAELYSMSYPDNIYTQLAFLVHELSTNYADVGNQIKASSTLTESVQIFQNKFERCGLCMESNRIRFAQDILASH